jgi:hypothetical protein
LGIAYTFRPSLEIILKHMKNENKLSPAPNPWVLPLIFKRKET